MRWVAVLVCLVACTGTVWREVEPGQLDRNEQLFIVTAGHAYVFELTARSTDSISGTAVRAWSFAPGSFSIRLDERPVEVAKRLDWSPELAERAPTTIRISDVLYASHQRDAGAIDSSLPFLAVLTGVVAMFAVFVTIEVTDHLPG